MEVAVYMVLPTIDSDLPRQNQCTHFAPSLFSSTHYMYQSLVHFATPPTVAGIDKVYVYHFKGALL
jgi:hypothetical protein